MLSAIGVSLYMTMHEVMIFELPNVRSYDVTMIRTCMGQDVLNQIVAILIAGNYVVD